MLYYGTRRIRFATPGAQTPDDRALRFDSAQAAAMFLRALVADVSNRTELRRIAVEGRAVPHPEWMSDEDAVRFLAEALASGRLRLLEGEAPARRSGGIDVSTAQAAAEAAERAARQDRRDEPDLRREAGRVYERAYTDQRGGDGASGSDARGSVPRDGGSAGQPGAEVRRDEQTQQKTAWIEIDLVDMEQRPVAGARYWIRLPDQRVVEGRLDAEGFAGVYNIDPGTCLVRFPDFDEAAVQVATR